MFGNSAYYFPLPGGRYCPVEENANHDAALADAHLIADDGLCAALDIVDRHGKRIDLLSRKVCRDGSRRYAEVFADLISESAVLLRKRLQRAFDLVGYVFRNKHADLGRFAGDRLIGNLAIGFLLLWLGLRALRRRLRRLFL